ncbi:MAG: STAS domain-containing protein [Desulfobacterales bacterium]|nr:MAG: STAS domain-containing protein [Desulfobacterales bacterium]
MEIIEQLQNEVCIFKLNGRLDSTTSHQLEEKIFVAIKNESNQMIIDFEGLDYISSAGLRVILKASKALKRSEGSIVLCSMQDYVKEVFEIAGFDAFLPIATKINDAFEML